MSSPILLVATPSLKGPTTQYFENFLRFQALAGTRGLAYATTMVPGQSLLPMARNETVARFLGARIPTAKSGELLKYTHLLFVDDDITFDPEAVFEMLAADKAVVGGACPLKKIDWEGVRLAALGGVAAEDLEKHGTRCNIGLSAESARRTEDGKVQFMLEPSTKCMKVHSVGTGFLLVKRETFEEIPKRMAEGLRAAAKEQGLAAYDNPEEGLPYYDVHEERRYSADDDLKRFMYFQTEIMHYELEDGTRVRDYTGEDFYFCRLCETVGIDIHAYVGRSFGHVGPYEFKSLALAPAGRPDASHP